MLELVAEQIVAGLITGSVYALIAVGLTMIYGALHAINFAHGEYYMLGAFSAWFVIDRLGVPYFASIFAAVVITAAIAALVGWLVMKRLVGAPFESGVLTTLGVMMILQNTVILMFGGSYRMFQGGWLTSYEVLGINLSGQRLAVAGASLAMFLMLVAVIRFTRMGKAYRAVSQNMECCRIVGIDVEKVVLWTFILGTGLAALSGVLAAPIVVSVYGGMGETVMLKCFAIVVMGGLGDVRGTLFAGLLLGVIEGLVATFLGLHYRDAVAYAALITVLMLRPSGLFSLRARF